MFGVLAPAGIIASSERSLMIEATLLMLIVMVPVLFLLFFFAWRYREGGPGEYRPNWSHAKMDELIWWAVPFEIILVLGALTYTSTHALDPRKAIASQTPAMTIEVVALPWKWLFIYPDLGVASVNLVELPVDTPINFEVTADAPMNSFWIPQLGGQIYAMTGMNNALQLMADTPGDYNGASANYSGAGFASMHFVAQARTPAEFNTWVAGVRQGGGSLSSASYQVLKQPGTEPVHYFASVENGLYHEILAQFDH